MKIERKIDGSVTILAFTGEFDAFNVPTIGERIDALIEKGSVHVVFNLRGLTFVDSSALGYLIQTAKRLRGLDGELVLSEPSKFFQTTIRTLGIDQIFKVFPNDNEAVEYFRTGASEPATGARVDGEALGSTTMFFRLVDAPETMAFGTILALHEDGPTFKYPADPGKIDRDELTIGRRLWIKFRRPDLEAGRFLEMEAEIVLAVDLEDGAVKFRLRYTKISDEDLKALTDFIRKRGDDDGTGVPARLRPSRPSDSGAASPPG